MAPAARYCLHFFFASCSQPSQRFIWKRKLIGYWNFHENKRLLLLIGCIINVFNVLEMNPLWPNSTSVLFHSGRCGWRPKLFILLAVLLTFGNLQLANGLILPTSLKASGASGQQVSDSQRLPSELLAAFPVGPHGVWRHLYLMSCEAALSMNLRHFLNCRSACC